MVTASLAPTIGRVVQVNLGTEASPLWRPAIIVQVWSERMLNLQLFTDGDNDRAALASIQAGPVAGKKPVPPVVWLTSIEEGTAARRWRWPPRATGAVT